jgi:hypothetical protein
VPLYATVLTKKGTTAWFHKNDIPNEILLSYQEPIQFIQNNLIKSFTIVTPLIAPSLNKNQN